MRSLLALLTFALALPLSAQPGTATYSVRFDATWSAATHPDGFPGNPHFSGLVGATHDAGAVLWAEGALASPGIESMAETGSKTLLLAEVNALIGDGRAAATLSGGGVAVSPGAVSLTFEVTPAHPLVSLVTMLAPSPDWFVGVSGLALLDGQAWMPEETITLYTYDAGTDSGTTYTAPNQNTNPPEPIALIEGAPFLVGGSVEPVGTFTFTLLSVTTSEEAPAATDRLRLDAPAPNPAAGRTTVRVHVPRAAPVTVALFDLLGRRLAVLHDGALAAGTHPLRVDLAGRAPGLYLIRARSGDIAAVRRLTVRRR